MAPAGRSMLSAGKSAEASFTKSGGTGVAIAVSTNASVPKVSASAVALRIPPVALQPMQGESGLRSGSQYKQGRAWGRATWRVGSFGQRMH